MSGSPVPSLGLLSSSCPAGQDQWGAGEAEIEWNFTRVEPWRLSKAPSRAVNRSTDRGSGQLPAASRKRGAGGIGAGTQVVLGTIHEMIVPSVTSEVRGRPSFCSLIPFCRYGQASPCRHREGLGVCLPSQGSLAREPGETRAPGGPSRSASEDVRREEDVKRSLKLRPWPSLQVC